MNRLIYILSVFLLSISIHAAIQIEALGLFLGPRDNRQQWIEVKNKSNHIVDVGGFALLLEEEELYRFPAGMNLKPQETVKVNFIKSSTGASGNMLCAVRENQLFTGKFYSSKENNNFTELYDNFRTFDTDKERREFYSRLFAVLHKVPTILERLYVKTPNGDVEDAVLITNIFIDKHDGYRLADLSKAGLMPITFLVSTGNDFVNRQALVLPKTFTVDTFRLGNTNLLISLEPGYLLLEPQSEVELYFYKDEDQNTLTWQKIASVSRGVVIEISKEDKKILETISSENVFYKMQIRAKNYQSEEIKGSAALIVMDSVRQSVR